MHIQLGTVYKSPSTAAVEIVAARVFITMGSLHVRLQSLTASKPLFTNVALERESLVVLTKNMNRKGLFVPGGETALFAAVRLPMKLQEICY